jgi:PhzF family phenazine biosynthesis protein
MTRSRDFIQVDVFTTTPYKGNPVAVVLDGADLSDEQMQQVASWTNLSETTFVFPPTAPGADYRVRIFTTSSELPFAGHPTLGTAHAFMAFSGVARDSVVQECGAGLVPVRRSGAGLAFAAPPLVRSGPVDEDLVTEVLAVLGVERAEVLEAQWADNGPGWVAVKLRDAERVLAVRPGALGAVDYKVGVFGAYPAGSEFAYEVRAFCPANGATMEDPVTGSLNASLAQWLVGTGQAPPSYVVSQGTALGRAGRVHIDQDEAGAIWVGGGTVACVRGNIVI